MHPIHINQWRYNLGYYLMTQSAGCTVVHAHLLLFTAFSLSYKPPSSGHHTHFIHIWSLAIYDKKFLDKCPNWDEMQTRLIIWSTLCRIFSENDQKASSNSIFALLGWIWSLSYWAGKFCYVRADKNLWCEPDWPRCSSLERAGGIW